MTEGVVVVGTGGHAASVLDAWDPASPLQPAGCVGPDEVEVMGLPWLGSDDALPSLVARGLRHVVIAVGSNALRMALQARCLELGMRPYTVIAPTAQVGHTAAVGAGSVLLHGVVVGARARVGAGAIVNTAASVDHDCVVGDFAHIAPGVHLAGVVSVGEGAFVGIGSAVIPGVTIGAWSTVGAGAAVVSDIPERVTVVGVPARQKSRSSSS